VGGVRVEVESAWVWGGPLQAASKTMTSSGRTDLLYRDGQRA
jgi:hypothetical protein